LTSHCCPPTPTAVGNAGDMVQTVTPNPVSIRVLPPTYVGQKLWCSLSFTSSSDSDWGAGANAQGRALPPRTRLTGMAVCLRFSISCLKNRHLINLLLTCSGHKSYVSPAQIVLLPQAAQHCCRQSPCVSTAPPSTVDRRTMANMEPGLPQCHLQLKRYQQIFFYLCVARLICSRATLHKPTCLHMLSLLILLLFLFSRRTTRELNYLHVYMCTW
jgi:hypothetical protein